MQLRVAYDFLPKQMSVHAGVVMDHFGIDFEQGERVVVEGLDLPLQPGDLVAFTGASGSGKSSLLRETSRQLEEAGEGATHEKSVVLDIDKLDLGNQILVDRLPLPIEESLPLLAACGLGEAPLLLRTPRELSDGQRYRFRLALGVSLRPQWLLADEFTATLDRTLACAVAYNLRRLSLRTGIGFLLATTHEDILNDLQPNLHVRCDHAQQAMVTRQEPLKKSRSPLPTTSGSVAGPAGTGRPSLGGITGAITSASSAT